MKRHITGVPRKHIRQIWGGNAVREYTSPIIFFFTICFWSRKINSFFLPSPFFDSTSTRYYFLLSTLPISIPSMNCSISLREFLYHIFL